MRRLDEARPRYHSYDTCCHKGRVFSFSQDGGKLLVTETVLGDSLRFLTVDTAVACSVREIGCCSLSGYILVIAGSGGEGDWSEGTLPSGDSRRSESSLSDEESSASLGAAEEGVAEVESESEGDEDQRASPARLFLQNNEGENPNSDAAFDRAQGPDSVCAFLVDIDGGRLSATVIHTTRLTVVGDVGWLGRPFLCQVSENRVLLQFCGEEQQIYCEIDALLTKITLSESDSSWKRDFRTLPICLPLGKLLMAGSADPSADITIAQPYPDLRLERVGSIPGVARFEASAVLVGERFVLGFGGFSSGGILNDLWVFDLETQRGSAVWERGVWHPRDTLVVLAVYDKTLYIMGRKISSISLQNVSELICDAVVSDDFCRALGLSRTPKHVVPPPRVESLPGMAKLQGFAYAQSFNTVELNGTILTFTQFDGELVVLKTVLFEQNVKQFAVYTGVDCGTSSDSLIGCCLMDGKILIMAGNMRFASSDSDSCSGQGRADEEEEVGRIFSALVSVEGEMLTREAFRFEELEVEEAIPWLFTPFLIQIAKDRFWLSFDGSDRIWLGEIVGRTLRLTRSPVLLPTLEGFGSPPLRMQDGRFLAAGTSPWSTNIVIFQSGSEIAYEKAGDFPEPGRYRVSTILLGEQFVVGFGGWNGAWQDGLWIFDLASCRASSVRRKGAWHERDAQVYLFARDSVLYLLGGVTSTHGFYITLPSLCGLIEDKRVRRAFRRWLGMPFPVSEAFRVSAVQLHLSHCL